MKWEKALSFYYEAFAKKRMLQKPYLYEINDNRKR
jgi:hypothetical protein